MVKKNDSFFMYFSFFHSGLVIFKTSTAFSSSLLLEFITSFFMFQSLVQCNNATVKFFNFNISVRQSIIFPKSCLIPTHKTCQCMSAPKTSCNIDLLFRVKSRHPVFEISKNIIGSRAKNHLIFKGALMHDLQSCNCGLAGGGGKKGLGYPF